MPDMFEAVEMLFGSTLGGAGLFLLVDGVRGRRVGREPSCGKCGYSLVGRVEGHNRCPECGSWLDLSGAVRYGVRRRQPRRAFLGMAMMLLAVGWLVMRMAASLGAFDVMSYKPAWWVFNEMKSGTPGTTRELYNRLAARKLSQARIDQIADWVLARQADRQGPWSDEWADFIEMAHRCNLIDKARWERYIRQGYAVQLRIRPAIGAGDKLPVEWRVGPLRMSSAIPSLRSFSLSAKAGELLQQNRTLALGIPDIGTSREGEPFVAPVPTLASAGPGRHKLTLVYEITAGGMGSPLTKLVESQTMECEVIDRPATIGLKRPDLRRAIVNCLTAEIKSPRKLTLIADNPPLDLAFDVTIPVPGRRVQDGQPAFAGQVVFRKGTWTRTTIDCAPDLPATPGATVQLILHPSSGAAAQTIDIREYWDGEAIAIDKVKSTPQVIGR